jgi:hypothetical protein
MYKRMHNAPRAIAFDVVKTPDGVPSAITRTAQPRAGVDALRSSDCRGPERAQRS